MNMMFVNRQHSWREGNHITSSLKININDPFGANNLQVKHKLLNEKLLKYMMRVSLPQVVLDQRKSGTVF